MQIERVGAIAPEKSGKYRYVISRVQADGQAQPATEALGA
jgi:hypothetical protein